MTYSGINIAQRRLTGVVRGQLNTDPAAHPGNSIVTQLLRPTLDFSETTGSGGLTRLRISDFTNKDYGLVVNQARPSGKFGRDSVYVLNPGASYNQYASFHKVHRNRKNVIRQAANGTYYTGSTHDNYFVQHPIPRSTRNYRWISGTLESSPGLLGGYGYAPASFMYRVTSSAGYLLAESMTFTPQSDFGTFIHPSIDRDWETF